MNFKPGDVCVIIAWPMRPDFVGLECEITGFDHEKDKIKLDRDCAVRICGKVSDHPTGEFSCMQSWLRLKRPPNKDEFVAGEWELCPFNPYKKREMA